MPANKKRPAADDSSKSSTISPRDFLDFLTEESVEAVYWPPKQATLPSASSGQTQGTTKEELLKLRDMTLSCTKCQELASTRNSVVFGAGNIAANLMFIGEAPGSEEDKQGLPFVGRAGQLLTKIIESIGLTRRQVFIANTLKCRPPQNRAPRPEEMLNCEPFLFQQIDLIRPKVICALGSFAAQVLLKTGQPIGQLRGKQFEYRGAQLVCTYHPAYLLRNPHDKRKVWEDMKKIKRLLEQP